MAQALLQSVRSLRSTDVIKNLAEFHHSMMGYRAKGLRYDDLIPEENDLVQQALRRLPEKEHYDRIFRMRRAINLSSQQTELETKDHTKPHEDVPYLGPLITLVENEIATKESFDHLSSIPAHLLKRNNSTAV